MSCSVFHRFLAAMSSSSSDLVTQSVCSFVRPLPFFDDLLLCSNLNINSYSQRGLSVEDFILNHDKSRSIKKSRHMESMEMPS